MLRNKENRIRLLVLLAGIGMCAYGIARGEMLIVLRKAAAICLECCGIG
ncbi:MAG: hypothetical protein IJ229_11185 [Clostridia bacterium]|nr:hypothetical protein [Clostridia bacterium]MBR1685845.1 hypothetical protein [Clostridia bacterium]MBR2287414.1 hypothetical protein [Clostridia bacterium]